MKKQEKKKTAGAEVYEKFSTYQPGGSEDVTDLQKEMQADYFKLMDTAIQKALPKLKGDFYVVVITKHEKIYGKALNQKFLCRQSCPSPQWDEAVFKYHRGAGAVEFLWVVPCRDACHHLTTNALLVAPEERQLRDFALDFQDGTLLRRAKQMNGEEVDSPLLKDKKKIFKGI